VHPLPAPFGGLHCMSAPTQEGVIYCCGKRLSPERAAKMRAWLPTNRVRCHHGTCSLACHVAQGRLFSNTFKGIWCFAVVATIATCLTALVFGQDKSTFILRVTGVSAPSYLVIDVRAESKTVRYELTCTEGDNGNSCHMPQLGKDYEAMLAPNPDSLYVYGITNKVTIFKIVSQTGRTRGRIR
jgi:hypothetical protein